MSFSSFNYQYANTALEYVIFDLPGWIEQNSNPSQRQHAREPKIPLS